MIDFLTQLVNGIPVYMWAFMALVLIVNALVLYLSIPDEPEVRRHTTTARNPTRKARMER